MFNPHLLRDVGLPAWSPWTFAKALSASFAALVIAWLFVLVKRLFFHPLRNVPGPKLAAATGWYEFYFDVIRGGAFSKQFAGFHEKYGKSVGRVSSFHLCLWLNMCIVASSIIRISPNHVHINDPGFYNE